MAPDVAPPAAVASGASSSSGSGSASSSARILQPPRPRSVLIIGGGAAGLVTLRNLLQHGPDDSPPPFDRVQVVERRADIGGVWHIDSETLALEQAHKNHHADGLWPIDTDPTTRAPTQRPHWPSPAYPQLRGNVLPPFLSFSDFHRFPAPAHGEPYPTLAETYDYLRDFADNAELGAQRKPGLWPYIRLSTEVLGAVQLPPDERTGQPRGWAVRIAEWADGQQNRRVHTEHWDAVVLATAWYDNPVYPRTPGIEAVRSAGKLVHAKWYRSPLPYHRKRVLIVGNGNSSNDIAAHLAALKPLPGPGVSEVDAEPIYRSIKHPPLPNFVSLPDPRIRDVAFIERYDVHDDDVVDVYLNDGTILRDVGLVILGVGYDYGYSYAHLLKDSALSSVASLAGEIPDPKSEPARFESWDPLTLVQAHEDLFERAIEESKLTQLPAPQPSDGTPKELAREAAAEAELSDAERAEPVQRIKGTFLQILSTHRGGNNGTLAFVGLVTVFWPFVVADFSSRVLRALWDGSAPEAVAVSDRDETVHSNDPERLSGTKRAPERALRLYGRGTQLAREEEERARVRDLQRKRAMLREFEEQRRAEAAAVLARRNQEGGAAEADKALFQTPPDLMTKYHCPAGEEIAYIHTLRAIILASRPDLELERGVYEVPADPLAWQDGPDTLWAGGGRDLEGRGVGLLRADDEALRRRNAAPSIKLETLWAARRRLVASGAYGQVGAAASDVEGGASSAARGAASAASGTTTATMATTLETVALKPGQEAQRQAAIDHQQGGAEGVLPAALAGVSLAEGAPANGKNGGAKPLKAEWKLSVHPGANGHPAAVPAEGSIEIRPPPDTAQGGSALSTTLATLDKARNVLNAQLTSWIGAVGKEDGGGAVPASANGKKAAATKQGEDGGDEGEEDDDDEEEEEDGGDDGNVHARPPAAAAAVAH